MSHVFVVHADLMRITCDAWLVPGGFGPGATWRAALPAKSKRLPLPDGFGKDDGPRAALYADVDDDAPLPFLTDITGGNRHPPQWYVEGARDFVVRASSTLKALGRAPLHRRERHLLALPLVGTAGGGAAYFSGEITALLLAMLEDEAEACGVDVVLVLNEGAAWAAAQKARSTSKKAWASLPAPLLAKADALAARAREGELTVFAGAGLSMPAGLPSWKELLRAIALEVLPVEQRAAFDDLAVLDAAALLQQRLPPDVSVNAATAWLLLARAKRYGLGHALLANLPVSEVVTTNYDPLFEMASDDCGQPCARIPGRPVGRGERFILKMHGCVTHPASIVLTREDYLRFQENRSALAGIVQALLLTRHMLFVGFGFTDDNFHRIAHAVRSALRGDDVDVDAKEGGRFGTNLVLGGTLLRELWEHDLDWVTMAPYATDTAAQARLIDIFLDRVSASAANVTAHLGDDRYLGVLTDGERALRARLEALLKDVTADEQRTLAFQEVKALMLRLGLAAGGAPPRARR